MLLRNILTFGVSALAGGLLLAGCGGSSGGGSDGSTGTASFSVTDAPTDEVSNVYVTFDRIDVKPQDGEPQTFELEEPKQIDLLTLQGENAEPLIEDIELEAGEYNWVRLFVMGGCAGSDCMTQGEDPESTDSFVVEDGGGEVELFVPGGQSQSQNDNQRFVQLSSGFVITAGGHSDFTIDVELRKALTKPNNQNHYLLRPALRLVDNSEVGTITGTVDPLLVEDAGCAEDESGEQANAVYLYEGFNADAGDVNLDSEGNPDHDSDDTDGVSPEINPITTANVELQSDGTYQYTIGFVLAGEYTAAFTCDAVVDDPEADDDIDLTPRDNEVTVQENQTTEVNFSSGS